MASQSAKSRSEKYWHSFAQIEYQDLKWEKGHANACTFYEMLCEKNIELKHRVKAIVQSHIEKEH